MALLSLKLSIQGNWGEKVLATETPAKTWVFKEACICCVQLIRNLSLTTENRMLRTYTNEAVSA